MNSMPAQTKTDCRINATVGFSINTENIKISLLSIADKALYLQLYCNAQVCRHIGGAISSDQATIGFERSLKQNRVGKRLTWVIKDKNRNENLGIAACVWPKKPSSETDLVSKYSAELGLLLLPQFCGKGVAVEVLNALTFFGLNNLQLTQLTLTCAVDNIAMQKVMGKLAFAYQSNNDLTYWELRD
ncbi:GNAT family N-acetyltransferase [Thalassotalea fonticola]|uniref:GNAT family N-acetyltransferase n=1 Tax=Thalassotalea fonticola TaxID=3065649 RepID=A0ABZ0GUK2_9GAMM|nr:GNAT family N-acetyltransferase [Colwelliaceae bacterium S1-1]